MTLVARIRALPADLDDLAGAAAAEGFGMLGVLAREWVAGTQRFAMPEEALFAARDGAGVLLGIGGVTRDPWAPALRMRRFYVRPPARGRGIGRALVAAALDHARGAGAAMVRLRAPAAAARFWEGCGFRPIDDPTATHGLEWPGRG
ncbi:GNAT family N-acetyltransferase [Roseomonas fluvialis]|uniref:N-acetyltransferase domain-containing protein n=1 Tax=Roseomonas fluvialis TaxID=1750527 RepID=A0ABN6P393_9PROT|nr:GNAT family N-acetyltransferase [Roseomonas fluvialis]BDG72780.1 hypothetical protein Rmf_27090 [Roseomonas fluvialis]